MKLVWSPPTTVHWDGRSRLRREVGSWIKLASAVPSAAVAPMTTRRSARAPIDLAIAIMVGP